MSERRMTFAELEAAGRQVEAILRRGVESVSRFIDAFRALPPDTRRVVLAELERPNLEVWESEGGAL